MKDVAEEIYIHKDEIRMKLFDCLYHLFNYFNENTAHSICNVNNGFLNDNNVLVIRMEGVFDMEKILSGNLNDDIMCFHDFNYSVINFKMDNKNVILHDNVV